ncbi:MAG: ABC transporter substrate-binding protein [Candidatus Limnocylindria bacterium]
MQARLLCRSLGGAIAISTFVAACTGSVTPSPSPSLLAGTDDPQPTPVQQVASVPRRELLFPGKLLICSDLPYPPQEFFDERGEPIGSDIELGQEIARRLGLEAEIVNTLFDTIIESVLSGKCDIIISAQSITSEREQLVDMIPYFRAGQAFVVAAGNPAELRNELDLCGATIATQAGTIQSDLVRGEGDYGGQGLSPACVAAGKAPIRLREFDKDDQAIDALLAGLVDAYFLDSPAAGYHVLQRRGELELMGLTLDIADQGISVPKERPGLRDAVRTALDSMISDGTYRAILDRYGVGDASIAAP